MSTEPTPLAEVLITSELARRPARSPDYEAESKALATLAGEMAAQPGSVLQKVAEVVLSLCGADSSGVSILEPGGDHGLFRWHAMAGRLASHLGATLPRDASPCGVVIARDEVLLFDGIDRVFPALGGVEPRIHEVLLAPWHVHGEAIGTLWAIGHTPERRFDAEDARRLQSLARFAAAAYQVTTALDEARSARAHLEQRSEALREANEALRDGEARLRVALGAARMGTWRWEIAENRQVLDDSLQRMFGVEGQGGAMSFESFVRLVHPDDQRRVEQAFAASLTRGERLDVEFRVGDPSGRVTWLKDQGEVFYGAGGEPLFLTGACVDVTELKEAETALGNADRRKDEFLATLAHELRNPLTPLANGLELARSAGDANPALRRTFEIMDRQLHHLVRLVDDLLDVARINAGKIELSRERVALRRVIEHAIESTQSALDKRGHRLELAEGDEELWVDGDRQRLTQVFANLLSNAAKYTERGGCIEVRLAREGDRAVVSVRDNGLGIPNDALPHVFDLFSQVRVHQRQAEGGLGIGLSLVRSLTSMHGGEVSASSEGPGRGSTFVVRLPLCEAPPSVHAAGVAAAAAGGDDGLRILVADDNEDAAVTLAMLIEARGDRVVIAHDGVEAVERARAEIPHVAFLDIGMPRMNGLEAARKLREAAGDRPVMIVAVSGWGQHKDLELSREAGFDAHLVKPPRMKEVADVLARARQHVRRTSSGSGSAA